MSLPLFVPLLACPRDGSLFLPFVVVHLSTGARHPDREQSPSPYGFCVTDFVEPEGIAWTERDGTLELESPAPRFRWVSSWESEVCSAPHRDFMKPAMN